MFNYSTSTNEELINHVSSSSSAAISVAKKYHESKGNFDVVERINKARLVLKHRRVAAQLEQMAQETEGF